MKNQISTVNEIARITRVLKFNSKQENEDFSETRIEELLRSGKFIEAIKYRREMSTDILDDALDYVRGTAKRIGVSMPAMKSHKHRS